MERRPKLWRTSCGRRANGKLRSFTTSPGCVHRDLKNLDNRCDLAPRVKLGGGPSKLDYLIMTPGFDTGFG